MPNPTPATRIQELLTFVYGPETGARLATALHARVTRFRAEHPHLSARALPPEERLTEQDAILITYGDQVQEPGRPHLRTLEDFLARHTADVLSGVHILPFYPWTSDDGFSVVDYKQVDPALGDWEDVRALGRRFRLMFDAVINHISRSSDWFQRFLRDEEPYTRFFITVDPRTDLSQVVRPRTLPLLTPVETAHGVEHVWTTFSPDQIDLNYREPQVLLEIIDVLLFYAAQGAALIRLDAIAFMWKEIGTSCLHLPQTHALIQLFRAVLDAAAPNVLLVTETNVPHAENISYFGDGYNEAQMVYNFSLPPLTLHAFATGDAAVLQEWAAGLSTPSPATTYFNFMASHDGIGVRPAEGILSPAEIQALCARTERHGGFVSYRTNSDGSQSPYELNITYFDALNDPAGGEPLGLQVQRFLASQAILVGLAGVPGVYFHSLLGSRNWREGVTQTGQKRTINRQKLLRTELEEALADPNSLRSQVFQGYRRLLQARRSSPAFHPNGAQEILPGAPACFAFLRTAPGGGERVLCIHNVTDRPQTWEASLEELGGERERPWRDLLTPGSLERTGDRLRIGLSPYGVRWLQQG